MHEPDVPETPTVSASEPVLPRPRPSTVYHHYLLERLPDGSLWELGRGGMGVTYKAMDTNLHSPVALKIIGPQCFGGEDSRRRFVREARLAAQIRHPNVAAIHHLHCEGDEVFYSMELVDGVTAEAWVKGTGAMTVELALDVAMQVARALTAADRLRLVHRDIKPGNVMLIPDPADQTRVIAKVIDFGLAQSLAVEATPTVTTCGFVGTPQFASPEQVESLELDIRADIYSLGCTLWFLLTGEAPFVGSTARVIAQHLTSEPPWERLSHLPKPVIALLRHMIAKDREARPQTPVDLHLEISACRENVKRLPSQPAFIPLWASVSSILAVDRPKWRLSAIAAAVVLIILGFAFLPFPSQKEALSASREKVAPTVTPEVETSLAPAQEWPSTPEAMPGEIPGLAAVPPERPVEIDEVNPEDERGVPPREKSVQLTNFGLDLAVFSLTPNLLDPEATVDLGAGNSVSLSLAGLEPRVAAASADKAAKKSGTRTSSRKRVSQERRSTPFRPIEGIRRGVQGLVNRIF